MVVLPSNLAETFIGRSNPLSSRSRAFMTILGRFDRFPDGDRDKVRYLDNECTIPAKIEIARPIVNDPNLPVFVRNVIARDVLVDVMLHGDRDINFHDDNVEALSRSVSCKSVNGKLDGIFENAFGHFPSCNQGGHAICNQNYQKNITFSDRRINMIPACISLFKNLEDIILYNTNINKIENLDKNMNLKNLNLSDNDISKIENLEKNVNLEKLDLYGTLVGKIENLDNNINIEKLDLSSTKVRKIENLDNLEELKDLALRWTLVKKIENLEKNVNLERLDLYGTYVSKEEKSSFYRERTRINQVKNLQVL